MEFIIENCSSPGAQFSRSTNQVMLKIAEWINQNNEPDLMFIDFRRRLEKEAKINDNNARNIYPLLKNGGLVEYQAGGELETGSFFTRRGKAYIIALETKALIDSSDYTKKQKEAASVEVDQILENIVYDSVKLLIENKELNYSESLKWYVLFLSKFGKINRQEFALMIHQMRENPNEWEEKITPIIQQYRNQDVDITVKVRVRNDQKIQAKTGERTRLEEISYFTAYSYYSSLIDQSGITYSGGNIRIMRKKIKDYHVITETGRSKVDYLVEV